MVSHICFTTAAVTSQNNKLMLLSVVCERKPPQICQHVVVAIFQVLSVLVIEKFACLHEWLIAVNCVVIFVMLLHQIVR